MTGLEYFRRKSRLTITEVANAIGVSRPNVSRWEHGVLKIPKKRLDELSKLFHTDIENLVKNYDDTPLNNTSGLTGLEFFRRLHNITVADLAQKLGVTSTAVSAWERREKPIPRKRLDELAVIFDTDRDNMDKTFTETDKIMAAIQYHQQQLNYYKKQLTDTKI